MAEKTEKFIQIGVAALRDADGNFGPSFELFMKATDEVIASRNTAMEMVGKLFAQKIRQYGMGCEREGVQV